MREYKNYRSVYLIQFGRKTMRKTSRKEFKSKTEFEISIKQVNCCETNCCISAQSTLISFYFVSEKLVV